MIYITPFDKKTKTATAPSQEVAGVETAVDAAAMMGLGAPYKVTQNTMLFDMADGQALCISNFKVSSVR